MKKFLTTTLILVLVAITILSGVLIIRDVVSANSNIETPVDPGGETPVEPGGEEPDVPGEETPDEPDEPDPTPVEIKDFVFDDGVLVEYTGTDKHVEIPSSYSLGESKEVFLVEVTNWLNLYNGTDYVEELFGKINFKTVDADGTVNYYDDYNSLRSSNHTLPVKVYNTQHEYFTGDDFTVIEISSGVFKDSNIEKVTLNTGLEKINSHAFYGCENLTEISFPQTLKEIGQNAFYGCSNLKTVIFNESLETIGADAFNYCISLQNIELPSTVKTLNGRTFGNCDALTSFTFPSSFTAINFSGLIFDNCQNLKTINFASDSLTFFDLRAFQGLPALEKIEIPNVASVNLSCGESPLLNTIVFSTNTIIPSYKCSFNYNPDRKIYVPDALFEAWSTADGWADENVYKLSDLV